MCPDFWHRAWWRAHSRSTVHPRGLWRGVGGQRDWGKHAWQALHHPLPRDNGRSLWTERNGSASRNSFDLISQLFRSFFFLDSYGLGNNLKINLPLFLQVHPGPLLGSTDCPWELMDRSHHPVGGDRCFPGQWSRDPPPPPLPGTPCGSSEKAWASHGGAPRNPRGPGYEDKGVISSRSLYVTPRYWWVPQGLCTFQTILSIPVHWGPACHLRLKVWAGEGPPDAGRHRLRAESRPELTLRNFWPRHF